MSDHEFFDALRRAREDQKAQEEAVSLAGSLFDFTREAWPILKPEEPFVSNWHQQAVCAYLEAVSGGDILRLAITVPPGTMKSGLVSIFFHPWEWTKRPWLRYWGASYETRLAGRFSANSRTVTMSEWYQARWGHLFEFTREGEFYYENNKGGTRMATSPTSTGTGEHGHRIIIDDPINARAADATSKVKLDEANDWYDGTVSTRGTDLNVKHARIIVMQRLHESDLVAHVQDLEEWTILCLPERFEENHPYAWRGSRVHKTVKKRLEGTGLEYGDPREEGELLWPALRDDTASAVLAKSLTSHRAAGQLQQRPAAREGQMLLRSWWRFYDSKIRDKEEWGKLPRFSMVITSVDTPLKDKQTSDFVAIQCWGIRGADRYLLDLRKAKMNYPTCKREVREMARWARQHWRTARHHVLIENGGYGPELIEDIKREVLGVIKISPGQEGDKETRADSASDSLESGNVFLPGYGPPWQPAYDEAKSPADVVDFIQSCAVFPHGANDDDVDAWSQCMNWLKGRTTTPARGSSALLGRR